MIVNGYEIKPFSTLRKAALEGANLREAELRWANLIEANLRGTKLDMANLTGAYLTRASLSGADLRGARLSGADLRGADLREAKLTGATLRGADLTGADLSGAMLGGAEVSDTNIHTIQLGKDFGFVHEKILVIGCKTFELKDVNRGMLKELGKEHNYTDSEIRHYSGVILFTKKLLDEGAIQ